MSTADAVEVETTAGSAGNESPSYVERSEGLGMTGPHGVTGRRVTPRPWRVADALAVLGLFALGAWQLWPAAGPGRLPQNLDLMLQFVPNAAYIRSSLLEGRLPLWNPHLGAGMPFAADPGTGAWYLPAWVLLLTLPLYPAVQAMLWGHLLWAALGTYVCLRRVAGVSPLPAWIGSAAFALSTWLPGLAGMPVVLAGIAWLPWVLVAGHGAIRSKGRAAGPWIALLALLAATQALAGWPAGAYLTWVVVAALPLCLAPWRSWLGALPRLVLRLAAGAALALLLAAVLLVPAAELVGETSYAETRGVQQVAQEGYLTLLSWFRPAGGAGALESSQLYLGMLPLLLALAGLLSLNRRLALVFGALALVALLLAFGTHGPLFAPVYHWLPGFRIVYLPARLGIVAGFALAVLAALGAQRVLSPGWRGRQVALVASLAGGLGLLVLLQFWHSEGYDDFRRLLTNVGRFAGGPFLTREQEAHYLGFGLLGLGALLAATWLPPRVSGALLVLLTAADLGLAQWRANPPSFEPGPWYARAFAATSEASGGDGTDLRLAGMQWHGEAHFLSDFPRSADPSRLPPNLALLTGARDAQAYNPLLLRRAVSYFERINGGRPDDHWLLIEDFRSPLVDSLAVGRILTPSGSSSGSPSVSPSGAPASVLRLGRPLLREGVTLPAGGAPLEVWAAPPGAAPGGLPGRLSVTSYLGQATTVPQGAPAIELEVRGRTAGGAQERRTVTLRAGLETGEWAYGRPDVQGVVRHQRPPVALESRIQGAVSGRYSVYEYLAAVDLPDYAHIDAVSARSLLPGVSAHIQGLSLAPVPETRFDGQGGLVTNRDARPRATVSGGTVTWVMDRPEHAVLDVRSAPSGQLILADTFYPGWTATVDGAPVTIEPAEGLFRAVPLPPGAQRVELRYRPPSLWLGLGTTMAGLVIAAFAVISGFGIFGAGRHRFPGAASQGALRATPPSRSSPPTTQGPSGPGA